MRHFTRGLAPARERTLRTHLAVCDACRDHYDDVLAISGLDPRTPSSEERLGRALDFRAKARPVRWRVAALPALAGVLAASGWLLFAIAPRTDPHPDSGFLARGGELATATEGSRAASLSDLVTYAVETGRTPRAVQGVIGAQEELAFAYRNPTGKQRLMVFAIDEHGHVYWYHPGWPDPATNPKAVPISTAPGLHELPAAVLHTYDGERLMLHALFTDRELTVRQVEAALARRQKEKGSGMPDEAFRDGVDVVRGLRVKGPL